MTKENLKEIDDFFTKICSQKYPELYYLIPFAFILFFLWKAVVFW